LQRTIERTFTNPNVTPRPVLHRPFGRLGESFFGAGFECSDHRLADGRRLDLLASTRHIEFAAADYLRLRKMGISWCREGASWVRCEPRPGQFDFSSLLTRLHAGKSQGVDIIWDLMHFGWPDDVDVFGASFPRVFARYAAALARFLCNEGVLHGSFSPINEISFLAWAAGDMRYLYPFQAARGVELKTQLVRATIEAIEAIRGVLPDARFLQPEPVIHIVANPGEPKTLGRVESDNLLQYQTWDMLTGRVWPQLGGGPQYLDVVGVNFYPGNQFMPDGTTIERGDLRYKPFATMLKEVQARYGRPMIVSETGSEGDARAPWLEYVAHECVAALRADCDLSGITLYPIVNHAGWDDDRHCHNGLWDYANDAGEREAHQPLCMEMLRQSSRLSTEYEAMRTRVHAVRQPSGKSLSIPTAPPQVSSTQP
jgi:hypothetical protein